MLLKFVWLIVEIVEDHRYKANIGLYNVKAENNAFI
jgi:hypothetical protein